MHENVSSSIPCIDVRVTRMREWFGIETRLQLAITAGVLALVTVTTLGGSGGAPWVFLLYRSLLAAIAVLCWMATREADLRVSRYVIAGTIASIILMLVSVLRIEGSHFEGFYLWYKHSLFLCAFIALANYARYQSARWKGVVLGSIVALSILHAAPDLITRQPRVEGFSSNNPNYFATFMLIGLAGTLAVAAFGTRPDWRIVSAMSAGFLLYCIALTSSRGAALGAAAAIGVAAFRSSSRIPRRVWIAGGILAAAMMAASSPYLLSKLLDRGQRDPYNYARTEIWRNTLPVIANHPFLGVGFGQFINVSKRFAFPVERQAARYLKRAQMAHNEYLQHMAEIGIPAALLLFAMFGTFFLRAWNGAKQAWPEYRCFSEAAILTAVATGMHALVDNCWTIPVMASGLVVFSLADLLPLEKRRRMPAFSAARMGIAAVAGGLLYVHSTAIPGIALAYNEAGHEAFQRSDLAKSERLHLAALRFAPDHPLFLDNLGLVYLRRAAETNDREILNMAEEYFGRAIAAGPNALDTHIHMETLLVRKLNGNLAHDTEIYKQIVRNNTELLDVDPYIPFPRRNLAVAFYYLGERERAMAEVRQAVVFEPNYVPGYFQLAEWSAESGNLAESNRYKAKAVEIVAKYRDLKPADPYLGILLGRPEASWATAE